MLDRFSDGLQSVINTLLGARGKGRHPIKSLLAGSWLGHPLHPLITDIAIGGVTLAAICDAIWLIFPQAAVWAPRAAEVTLIVGVLGMLGSFFTGWSDWSDTYGKERTTGVIHGLLNSFTLVLVIIAIVFSLLDPTGKSMAAAVLTFISFALLSYTSYLGGDLVFKDGTNVNHTAWEHGSDTFERVGSLSDFPDGQLKRVEVDGVPVVVVNLGGKVYALAATCTHAGGPLDEGTLESGVCVRCPWHGSRFRLRDGKVVDGPATVAEPVYDVQISDGVVSLKRR